MRIVLGGVVGIVGMVACARVGDDDRAPLDAGVGDAADAADSGSCPFKGVVYREGRPMPPEDCNTCYCSRGQRNCTAAACPQPCRVEADAGEISYGPGEAVPSTNACESCRCDGFRGVLCEPIADCISEAGAD
ncbi:MAG: hypothetical protein HOO96_27025 [Polyangiaceae bacterium]|nr:hypothetical protein [Polyangiaceae bacterium]